jgi:hypothetical protein
MFKLTQHSANTVLADERLYLTADRQTVVKEGDPRAASLLVAKGQPVPKAWADKLTPQPSTSTASQPKAEATEPTAAGVEPERRQRRPKGVDFTR